MFSWRLLSNCVAGPGGDHAGAQECRLSPSPAKAAIVPQIADAKSEAEILFRGKSFAVVKRNLIFYFSGEIVDIPVKEGQAVNKDDTLAAYKIDRESATHVHNVLYPEQVLSLKKSVDDQQINLDKLTKVSLAVKRLDVERVEKELSDLRELQSKEMAQAEAVKNKDRQLQQMKKEILEIEDTIRENRGGSGQNKGRSSFLRSQAEKRPRFAGMADQPLVFRLEPSPGKGISQGAHRGERGLDISRNQRKF